MNGEKIISIIPHIKCQGMFAVDSFVMFLTNKRIVLILSGKDYFQTGAFLGGFIGAATAYAFSWEKPDFDNVDLDSKLKEDNVNKEIPLEIITDIRFKKVFGEGYRIQVFGFDKNNKHKKLLEGFLIPTKDDIEKNIKAGFKKKVILDQYFFECQRRIENLLGHKISQKI